MRPEAGGDGVDPAPAFREAEGKPDYRMLVSPGGVKLTRRRRVGERKPESSERSPEAKEQVSSCRSRGVRKEISRFTPKSRQNMAWTFGAIPWGEIAGRLAMVTLTYPQTFPMDGLRHRRNRDLFRQAWYRRWGNPQGVWALEFQERGAPHIHMYIGLPGGAELHQEDRMKGYSWEWALGEWYRIVGSGESKHRFFGVNVRPAVFGSADRNGSRVARYFWRESGKWAQKQAPEGYTHVGRFWGTWGVRPREHELGLDRDEFVRIRRPVRLLRNKVNGRKVRNVRSGDGLQVVGVSGLALGARLTEWGLA